MPADELNARRERLADLRRRGFDPYPSQVRRTHTLADVLATFDALRSEARALVLCGRVTAIRRHGGATFFTLDDGTASLQAYGDRDGLGAAGYALLDDLDAGDFLEVSGYLFTTQRGERSVRLEQPPRFLAKTLRPLPEKWHGLTDVEARYRRRYLDLLVNRASRQVAQRRSALLTAARRFLDERGYLEVETPVLQLLPGGATARPFATHLNALALDLYLRVAPELYLKRLLVAGFPKVYEVARCFRNEGIDHAHNPEFTQVELYEAYADYRAYMGLVEEMLRNVVPLVTGKLTVAVGDLTVNFTPPYSVRDWTTALDEALGVATASLDAAALRSLLLGRGIAVEPSDSRPALLDVAYKKLVLPQLVEPTFLVDHPVELSPLAKRRPGDPARVERFQLIAGGLELMNGFSELNDPDEQRQRFLAQEQLRAAGDEEAQRLDEDFLLALEHGMPPAAGLGIGIDRLAALLTGCHSLREVILFPTLRPAKSVTEGATQGKG